MVLFIGKIPETGIIVRKNQKKTKRKILFLFKVLIERKKNKKTRTRKRIIHGFKGKVI